MPVLPSTCPLDCPDRCSLDVEVEGATVRAIRGSHRHPWTEGYICAKVARFGQRVHGPERILHPAVRVGPKGPGARYVDVSWEEALQRVAERFQTAIDGPGAEAILPVWYGGSNGMITGGGMDMRFWNRLGASRCGRTLCAANTGAGTRAVYGGMASTDPADVAATNLLVLWGVNPSASGIHLVPPARAVQARGGSLIVVDPRRTPLARQADLHLAVLPGTDVALALALVHLAVRRGHVARDFLDVHADGSQELEVAAAEWTPDRAAAVCGVPAADIVRFAELYAAAQPALVRCGWGVERNRNGSDAVKAVLTLPAVYGKFGVRGGGYVMSTSSGYRMDAAAWQGPTRESPRGTPRTINLSQLAAALEDVRDPPVEVLYVYNCNPAVTVPDQARLLAQLARDDLYTVVHEQVWTDTCAYADVILPATTFLEHEELTRSYGGYVLQWSEAVVPPVGEARSNHAVFQALAERLGLTGPDDAGLRESPQQIAAAILAATPGAVDFATLQADRAQALPSPVQFVDTFPPARIQLAPPPRHLPPPADAERPLVLISPATSTAISSTGYEAQAAGSAELVMHPEDAGARGLQTGSIARAWNSRGEVRVRVRVGDEVRPGVVSLPKGLWRSATLNGWTSNALIPAHVDATGGGACYNDARVDVEAG